MRHPITRAIAVSAATFALLARSSAEITATPLPTHHGAAPGRAAERDAMARTVSRRVSLDGQARRYRLHVPVGVAANASLPLVVAFHGAGSSTLQQERASGLSSLADREGFVVVYPEGVRQLWSADARDDRFVREVVADVAKQMRIDTRRIYATGISNGAAMADRAACAMSDLFAAVSTVAGAYASSDDCQPTRAVPIYAFHGLADRVVPFAGRGGARPLMSIAAWSAAWADRNGCADAPVVSVPISGVERRAWRHCDAGADVTLETIDELGHAWPGDPTDTRSASPVDASAEIWAFFASHPMN